MGGNKENEENTTPSARNRQFAVPPPIRVDSPCFTCTTIYSPIGGGSGSDTSYVPSDVETVASPRTQREVLRCLSPPRLVRSNAAEVERRLTLGSRFYTEEERVRLLDLYGSRMEQIRTRAPSRRRPRRLPRDELVTIEESVQFLEPRLVENSVSDCN